MSVSYTHLDVYKRQIYPDTAQIVGWKEGMEMRPHADNMMPDGGPNNSPHRNYTTIIYLNDDYEGGNTYFPSLGVRVAPKAGSLVVFGAGYEYVHGVTMVTRGKRYIYSGWFTPVSYTHLDVYKRQAKGFFIIF